MFKNLAFKNNNPPQIKMIVGKSTLYKKLNYLKLFAPYNPYPNTISLKRKALKGLYKREIIFTINPKNI